MIRITDISRCGVWQPLPRFIDHALAAQDTSFTQAVEMRPTGFWDRVSGGHDAPPWISPDTKRALCLAPARRSGAAGRGACRMGAQRLSIFGWFTRSAENRRLRPSYGRQKKAPASLKGRGLSLT